jgi:hypothetical protein
MIKDVGGRRRLIDAAWEFVGSMEILFSIVDSLLLVNY